MLLANSVATRLSFLAAGFSIACWAPLVPYARDRLQVDDAALGLLLLCLGIGSVVAMLAAGVLTSRFGSKPVIICSGFGLALLLPTLAYASTPIGLSVALLGFGAALGSLEVGINVHAVEVERASSRPMMSGFHAMFSVGGFTGSAAMTSLLSASVPPITCTLICTVGLGICIAAAWPGLITGRHGEAGPLFSVPRGIVVLLAALCAATFLVEGAMLDWGALLLVGSGLTETSHGGLGYMVFAVAMTAGRLAGDRVVARLGQFKVLVGGGAVAVVGLLVVVAAPTMAVALFGFLLIGTGGSNLVPILFSRAGRQRVMPVSLAVAAITTIGYAGILLGPALIGFAAHAIGLQATFGLLALLMASVPLTARMTTAK